MPVVTMTTANDRNGITPGRSRVTVKTELGQLVDQFEVPARQPRMYLLKHPRGQYAGRLRQAQHLAKKLEQDFKQSHQLALLVR